MLEILIVDDEKNIARVMVMMLEKFFGEKTRISVYYTLEEALLRVENGEPFDLVITDFHVPHRGEGQKIIEAVKAKLTQTKTKVILMSGNISDENLREAKPDFFISKPFSLEDMVNKIKEWFPELR